MLVGLRAWRPCTPPRRAAARQPILAAPLGSRPAGGRCSRRAAGAPPPLAAAAGGSNGSSNGSPPERDPSSSLDSGSSNGASADPSSSSSPAAGAGIVPMRSLDATAGGNGSKPPESPQPRRARGRLDRLLGLLRSPLAVRRLLTVAFMFCLGSAMSLASSRGRCAGPQEVRRGGGRQCGGAAGAWGVGWGGSSPPPMHLLPMPGRLRPASTFLPLLFTSQLMYSEFLALVRSGNVRAARFEESSARITFDLRPHSTQAAALAPRPLDVPTGARLLLRLLLLRLQVHAPPAGAAAGPPPRPPTRPARSLFLRPAQWTRPPPPARWPR